MTITIEITAQTQTRLQQKAAQSGVNISQYAQALLEDAAADQTPTPDTLPALPSPFIDRLATPQGRAHALASVQTLRSLPAHAEDDDYDIEKALAEHPFTLREVTLPEE